jgi:hypothetical protein
MGNCKSDKRESDNGKGRAEAARRGRVRAEFHLSLAKGSILKKASISRDGRPGFFYF